jgi:hypothetical protein
VLCSLQRLDQQLRAWEDEHAQLLLHVLHLLLSHVAKAKAIHPGVQRSICCRQRKHLQAI